MLDMLRGFSLFSMIAYHAVYDIVTIYNVQIEWFKSTPGYLWQQSICWIFILVSGASLNFARSALRQGIKVFCYGMVITIVTMLVMPYLGIWFGILHFMGAAMMLTAVLRPVFLRVAPGAGLAVSFALFLILKGVPQGFIGIGDIQLLWLPKALYSVSGLFPLGFPTPDFSSSDYFPIIPWIFLFWAGFFAWRLIEGRLHRSAQRPNLLELAGQHSLPIYMLHQPILYGILLVVSRSGIL